MKKAHSTYIQKLVVGDIVTGIEEKSIYKVITPRKIEVTRHIKEKKITSKLINDDTIHNWHFVNKSFDELPKQLTKDAIEIDKVTITNAQFNWICSGQILIGEHFFE
tara:strand:+ start:8662 stop:8982 length:321 start_codon:yes stop_codon:yes gene_type:complete